MGIKVEINKEKVCRRLKTNNKIGLFLAQTWAKELNDFVPMDKGPLYTNKTIQPFKIIYNMPYAKYQFYGRSKKGRPLNYNREKHSLATSKWNEKGSRVKGKKVASELTAFLKRI